MLIRYKDKYLQQKAYNQESGGALFELTEIKDRATWFNTVAGADEAVDLAKLNIKYIVYVEVD